MLNDAQPFERALVGGMVGTIIALILVGGLIAFIMSRKRRRGNAEPNSDAPQSAPQSMPSNGVHEAHRNNNYIDLPLGPPENNYGEVQIGPPQNYDEWSTKGENYGKPPPNRTDYEDFTKVH